jgi:hypothetical protein
MLQVSTDVFAPFSRQLVRSMISRPDGKTSVHVRRLNGTNCGHYMAKINTKSRGSGRKEGQKAEEKAEERARAEEQKRKKE